jgi:hypothetical protein
MFDKEKGREMTDKEIISVALEHLSEACCFLFETESSEGNALAFMVDSALKYGQVVIRDDDPLSAAADYTAYENKKYNEHKKLKSN